VNKVRNGIRYEYAGKETSDIMVPFHAVLLKRKSEPLESVRLLFPPVDEFCDLCIFSGEIQYLCPRRF
jgi:hypothetical protein